MKHISKFFVVVFIGIVCLGLAGCFKKSSKPSETASRLLKLVPEKAFGYFVWDGAGSAFNNFRKSPWAKGSSLFTDNLVDVSAMGADATPKNIIKILEDSGLVGTDKNPSKLNAAVGYFSIDANAQEPGEMFVLATMGQVENANAGKDIVTKLKGEFSNLKNTTVTDGCGTFTGFKAGPAKSSNTDMQLYLCANDDKIVLTSKLSEAKALFESAGAEPSETHLLKSAELAQINKSIKGRDKEYLFAYADILKLLQQLPAEMKKDIDQSKIPVKAVAFSRQMHQAPKDSGFMLLGSGPGAEELDSILSTDGSINALQHLAGQSAFSVGLDMRLFAAIEKILSDLDSKPTPEELAILKKMLSFGVGIEEATAGSPFPTVTVVAKGEASEELKKEFESNINEQVASNGLPAGGWQSKDVDGSKMRYLATPFGIGLYAGVQEDAFVISSNEVGFKNRIKAADENLMAELKKQLSDEEPEQALALAYVDFSRVAEIVTNVQKSLGMFLGGQSNLVSPEQVNELKSFGKSLGTLHYDDKLLTFSNVYVKSS